MELSLLGHRSRKGMEVDQQGEGEVMGQSPRGDLGETKCWQHLARLRQEAAGAVNQNTRRMF